MFSIKSPCNLSAVDQCFSFRISVYAFFLYMLFIGDDRKRAQKHRKTQACQLKPAYKLAIPRPL